MGFRVLFDGSDGSVLSHIDGNGGTIETGALVVDSGHAIDIDAVGGGVVCEGHLAARSSSRNFGNHLARAAELEARDFV